MKYQMIKKSMKMRNKRNVSDPEEEQLLEVTLLMQYV
jgi:hypothetical protein